MTNRMKFLENLKMKKLRKGQKGFTLIELLVVIAILGVIAAVAVPNILSFMGSGDSAAKDAELHTVQTAVSAALYGSTATPRVVVAHTMGQLVATPGAAVNDAIRYLQTDTSWQYSIATDGTIVQGAKVT